MLYIYFVANIFNGLKSSIVCVRFFSVVVAWLRNEIYMFVHLKADLLIYYLQCRKSLDTAKAHDFNLLHFLKQQQQERKKKHTHKNPPKNWEINRKVC